MLSTREARAVVSPGNLTRFTEMCGIYSDCGKRVDMVSFMLNLFDYITCRSAGFPRRRPET
jgi:hypothetical protein